MKSLIGVGKNIINVTSQFEQTQKALETVTQSAEKGKKLFEDLRKFSFDTTFGVDELANASSQLLNVGVSSSVLQKDLKMLGDLAQGDKVKFQELTSIFSKIQSTGKASSMQLQQLALRGIPIQKTLKEMGVTGTASAKQLTEAFEKLTDVGGQFHDAMNNIIDTIEGKKGFITDTIKEINVNFGELSGLTDGYKKSLDFVYDILDMVNNKLMEWNENPMMKAIIRGTLVAGITTLAVTIGVGLVGAIKTLNRNLAITATLKAILNPTAVALAVGIGAITGLAVALETATGKANEYTNKIKEVDALADKYGVRDVKMSKARKAVNKGTATTQEKLAVAVEDLQSSKLFEKQFQMQYNAGNKNAQFDLAQQQAITKEKQKQVDALFEIIQLEEKRKNSSKTITQLYSEQQDAFNEFTKSLGNVYQEYSSIAKVEKELKEITDKRAELEEKIAKVYHGFDESGLAITLKLSEEEKAKFDKDVDTLLKKERELKIKLAVDKQEDWQKKLQSAFGFTNQEVANGATETTVGALKYFEKMTQQMNDLYSKYGMDVNKYSDKATYANAMESAFEAVLESVREGTYTGTEESLKDFADAVKKAKDAVTPFTAKLEEWTKKQINNGNVAGGIAGTFAGNMLSQSNDVGNFASGFAQGGLVGGIANAVGGALSTVASEVEGMDRVMNPLTDALRTLTPLFELLVGVMKPIFATLDGIKDVLHTLIEGILRPFEPLIRLISGLFEKLANLFTKMFDSVQPLLDIIEMLVDTVFSGIDALLEPILQGFQAIGILLKIIVEISKPFIQAINVISALFRLLAIPLRLVVIVLEKVLGFITSITDPLMESMQNFIDTIDETLGYEKEVNDEKKKELEELRRAKEAYASLLDAMEENEAWYIRQRTALNANTRKDSYSVNDMILTPQGQFSTHPDDYIIATKNPQSLGGGAVVNVNIENNVSDVEVSATPVNRNGIQEIMIQISKKIADDVANGANGWDSALARQSSRQAGRQLSF